MEEVTTGGDERIAFGTMAKGQKKYGSTTSNLKKSEDQSYFVYDVQRGDTLQGLAVKFGISTQQIRRANQLWTNDSLFLRDKLLIPSGNVSNGNGSISNSNSSTSTVYANGDQSSSSVISLSESHQDLNGSQAQCSGGSICSSQESPCSSKHWTHPLSDSFESEDFAITFPPNSQQLQNQPLRESGPSWTKSESQSKNGKTSPNSIHSVSPPVSLKKRCPLKDHSERSAEDFLSRIDTAIASSRKNVKSIADGGGSNGSKHWVTFESDSESDQNPRSSTGTSVRTEGRHLKYSLRKLERTQDELFQL